MPHTTTGLPPSTWGDLEAIFDSLAETAQQKETVHHLLLREVICIALVLLPVDAQPPQPWRWLGQGPSGPLGEDC